MRPRAPLFWLALLLLSAAAQPAAAVDVPLVLRNGVSVAGGRAWGCGRAGAPISEAAQPYRAGAAAFLAFLARGACAVGVSALNRLSHMHLCRLRAWWQRWRGWGA
jgi:hypothetical protein